MYWAGWRSTRARETRPPDCTVRSMMWPPRMSRSFMRTCAEPRPILMCWTSSTWYSVPSISRVTPFLRSPVSIIASPLLHQLRRLAHHPRLPVLEHHHVLDPHAALPLCHSERRPRSRPAGPLGAKESGEVERGGAGGRATGGSFRHLRRVAHHPRLPVLEHHHVLNPHAAPPADVDPRLDRGDHAVLQLVL